MKRPVWAAAALLGVLVASATLFAEGKRYPPYPEVWGYELAYPAPGSRHASPRAYTMPDGEIRFIFATTLRYEKGVPRAVEYAALDYFKGTLVPITRAEWDRFGREFSAHRVEFAEPTRMRVQFGDGSSVRLVEGMPWNLCGGVLFDTWLVALDPKGAERRSVHILYLRPDEVVKRVNPACGKWGGEEEFRYRVETVVPAALIPLADDSFVIWESQGNVILRLDRNLNTRFKLGERLFLLEHAEVERLAKWSDGSVEQQRHDTVLRHLLKISGRR